MAQKVTGIIKLQINAAKATASPPVGPALGQHGVNIAAFVMRCTLGGFQPQGKNLFVKFKFVSLLQSNHNSYSI